jgi:hypothetical protein
MNSLSGENFCAFPSFWQARLAARPPTSSDSADANVVVGFTRALRVRSHAGAMVFATLLARAHRIVQALHDQLVVTSGKFKLGPGAPTAFFAFLSVAVGAAIRPDQRDHLLGRKMVSGSRCRRCPSAELWRRSPMGYDELPRSSELSTAWRMLDPGSSRSASRTAPNVLWLLASAKQSPINTGLRAQTSALRYSPPRAKIRSLRPSFSKPLDFADLVRNS